MVVVFGLFVMGVGIFCFVFFGCVLVLVFFGVLVCGIGEVVVVMVVCVLL